MGWIVLDHQLALFSHWFGHYQQRILDTLETLFEDQCLRQLERLEVRCQEAATHFEETAQRDDEQVEREQWMREQIHADLARGRAGRWTGR